MLVPLTGAASNAGRSQAEPVLHNSLSRHDRLVLVALQGWMVDPVIAADGHTYERATIQQHLLQHSTSPVTGNALPHLRLVPNTIAKIAIAQQQQALE